MDNLKRFKISKGKPKLTLIKNDAYILSCYKYTSIIKKIVEQMFSKPNAYECEYCCSKRLPTEVYRLLIYKGYTVSENKVVVSKTDTKTVYEYKYIISWAI